MSFYFIFKISQLPGGIVKKLEKMDRFESYKEAKQRVRTLRANQSATETVNFKIIFAESELDAEEKLQEKRDPTIVMEWEK